MTSIVLIPGLSCTAEIFAPQIAALWPHGPITIANTLKDDSIDAIARNILAAAPPRFALAGISMGGYVSLAILRQAPERVTTLALLDTSARPDTEEQTAHRQTLIDLARRGGFELLMQQALTNLLHPDHQQDTALRETSLRMGRAVGIQGFIRQTEAIIARIDSRPFLPMIRVPTLVLVGDSDAITPLDRSEEIAAAIPGARLVVIPRCGHAATIEQPDAVNRAMLEWIAV